MKNITLILRNISTLYYVFVALFILSFIFGVATGIVSGLEPKNRISLDHLSPGRVIFMLVVGLCIIVSAIWSLVLFIKLLSCIGRSIHRTNIFNLRTVKLINRYAIIYGITTFLIIIGELLTPSSRLNSSDMYNYLEIINGCSQVVMLLILGQVLKIGHILRKEQELTI